MIALLLLAGLILLVIALLLRRGSAPSVAGKMVYSDTTRVDIMAPISSHKNRLTGKPDYIYRVRKLSVPVEVKKHVVGRHGPRASDIAQLMTYAVLLEDEGETVTHGLIEYPDKRFTIPYGPEDRSMVLEAAEAIRQERRTGNADRSHNEAWRCRACGLRKSCDQSLALSQTRTSI